MDTRRIKNGARPCFYLTLRREVAIDSSMPPLTLNGTIGMSSITVQRPWNNRSLPFLDLLNAEQCGISFGRRWEFLPMEMDKSTHRTGSILYFTFSLVQYGVGMSFLA